MSEAVEAEVVDIEVTKVEVECATKTYELADALVDVVEVIQGQLANGFQAGEDLPPVLAAVVQELVPVVANFTEVDDEYEGDRQATLLAVTVPFSRLV